MTVLRTIASWRPPATKMPAPMNRTRSVLPGTSGSLLALTRLSATTVHEPGLSGSELTIVADRCANEGLCAMGLRFSEDKTSPRERFTALKERLGDAFEVIEIDSRPGNEHGFGKMAHSVLTLEVREVDGQPAYEARKRVVEFLTQRLAP